VLKSASIRWGALAAFAFITTLPSAMAAEVLFEGAYRARFRAFDSLSIDKSLALSEGRTAYVQHRLWLRPRFLINEKISLYADFKGLDNVYWGDEPAQWTDPVTGSDMPLAWTDELNAPTNGGEEGESRSPLLDFTLWRAWGQIDTNVGQFTFGRMPLHWGSGVWQNDGLGINAEYGDTADRVQWEKEISSIFIRAAFDMNAEGLINANDDTLSANAAVAYRTERIFAGVNLQLKHAPSREFNLFTASLAGEATLGKLGIRLEAVGQFGGGDLENGANDVQVAAFGGVVAAEMEIQNFKFQLEGGVASGDGNLNDAKLRTFTFDRDYNVGLFMFEQPMPALVSANGENDGRATATALSGPGVSNALYLRPQISRPLPWVKGLGIQVNMLAARTLTMPESEAGRSSYGMEFNLGVNYEPMEHVQLLGTAGLFLPGSYYTQYSDTDFPDGFSGTVLGGQLITRVHF